MSKKTPKYNDAVDELNQILEDLQTERIGVDEVSAKVKRAIELIRFCRQMITKTETEVKKVVKEFDKEAQAE